MSVTQHSLGANFPGVGETSLRPGSAARQLLVPGVLFGAMVVGVLLAFQSDDLSYRLQMVSLAFAVGMLGVALLLWELSAAVGVVRIEQPASSLRFTYVPGLDLAYPLAAALIMVPAGIAGLVRLSGATAAEIGFGRRTPYVLGLLGLVFFVQQLWALRVSRGLKLTPEGIRGIRGMGRVALTWDDLNAASAMSTRSGAKLALHLKHGAVNVIPRRLIGSDPDAVAAIINYFLRHPADRGLLTNPETAIQRVAQSAERPN